MRGRRTLCQENGEDNEILSEQLKEIRRAASHDQLERIIKRIRRGGCARSYFVSDAATATAVFGKAASTLERHQTENDRNSKHLSQFLRSAEGAAAKRVEDSPTFDYFSDPSSCFDEQLMSVIRSPGVVVRRRRSGKWWPNGMSCEEFRDIRTVLFSNQSFRATPLLRVKETSTRRIAGEGSDLSTGNCGRFDGCQRGQRENEHRFRSHQVVRKKRNVGGDNEDSCRDSGGKLNKGFHWRVNFLLGRPEAQQHKKAVPSVSQSVDNGDGASGNCVVNWTIKSDKMCDIVGQFHKLQVSAWPDKQQQQQCGTNYCC